MRLFSPLVLIIVLQLINLIQSVNYPILVGYYIYDLYGTSTIDFEFLTNYWTVQGPVSMSAPRTGNCGSILLLGGTGLLGSYSVLRRTYTTLPTHSYISFLLRAVSINQWVSVSDKVVIYIDNQAIQSQYPAIDATGAAQSYCGNTNKDFIWFDTVGVMAHSATSLTLEYEITNSVSNTASFGLHNLNILFRTTTPYYTNLHCFHKPWTMVGCNTDVGYYIVSGTTSTLGVCDAACDSCYGPGPSSCFGCHQNYFFDGTDCKVCHTTCASCKGVTASDCTRCNSPLTLQADGTCSSSICSAGTTLDTNGGDFQQCVANICPPMASFLFYNLDGTITCMSSCTPPYTVRGSVFCDLCQPGLEFRFYDSTGSLQCVSSCAPPYQVMYHDLYCILCPLDQYISYDLSGQQICVSTCTAPFKLMSNNVYCLQCPLGQYISYDAFGEQTCVNTCAAPYQLMNSNTYCLLCPLGEYIFYSFLGQLACFQNCSSPYHVSNNIYCGLCNKGQFIYVDASGNFTCLDKCTSPYKYLNSTHCTLDTTNPSSSTSTIVASVAAIGYSSMIISRLLLIANPGSSGLLLWGCLSDMLQYIKYINIDYSPMLLMLFNMKSISDIIFDLITDAAPSLNEIIVNRLPNNPLPQNFADYGLNSSFLANTWEWLATIALTILIVGLSCLLLLVKKSVYVRRAALFLKRIFQWNYCISTFVSYYGCIVFYSSLEFLTASYCHTPLAFFSLGLCAFVNLIAIGFLIRIAVVIYAVRKHTRQQRQSTSEATPPQHRHHTGYAVVLEDYKSQSWLQQSFFVVYTARLYVFNTVIVYMYLYPIAQCFVITLLTLFMLVYVLTVLPMRKRLDQVQVVLQEMICLVVNIGVTILAFLDQFGDYSETRTRVESLIFWCNVIFFICSAIYVLIILGQQMKQVYIYLRLRFRRRLLKDVRLEDNTQSAVTNVQGDHLNLLQDSSLNVVNRSQMDITMSAIVHSPSKNRILYKPDRLDSSAMKVISGVGSHETDLHNVSNMSMLRNTRNTTKPKGCEGELNIVDLDESYRGIHEVCQDDGRELEDKSGKVNKGRKTIRSKETTAISARYPKAMKSTEVRIVASRNR